jgi:hypothetical protein
VVITVTPATASPKVGDTLRFSATIHDASGTLVPGPARWASTNTAKVTVDTAGLATVLDTGNVLVVATYSTSAATASLALQLPAGGPIPGFLRTWVGGAGAGAQRTDWANPNNWSPSFVPTQNDSVVIGTAAFQPIIPIDTFSVRDLVLRTGAVLNANCCSVRLRVGRVASGEGGTFGGSFAGLLMRNNSSLRGTLLTFVRLFPSSTVTLADTTRLSSFQLDTTNATLDLSGWRLSVNSNVLVTNGGLLRIDGANDTLEVNGQFQITTTAASHLASLSAGTVILRSTANYFDGFTGTGTNTVVIAGASSQSINSMNFQSNANNAFQNLVVSGAGGANVCAYVRVQGTFTIPTGAGPVTSCSSYIFKLEGAVTTAANTSVGGSMFVQLMHPTGTANVGGLWAPAYTDFLTASQTIRGGLQYQNVRFFASQVLADTVVVAGTLQVDGASTAMAITAPRTIKVGTFNVTSGATFTLDQPGDTLQVLNNVNTSGAGSSVGKLTDGVLRVAGNIDGTAISGSGNFTVILDGGVSAQQFLNGFNYNASPATGLARLHIANVGGASLCSYLRIADSLVVSTAVNFTSCSSYTMLVGGPVRTVLGSNVNPYQIQLSHASGTANVAGTWAPSYTDFMTAAQTVKGGLSYQYLRLFASQTLTDTVTAAVQLYLDGAGTVLNINAPKRIVVAGFQTATGASFVLDSPADTLDVRGNFSTSGGGSTVGKLTDGVVFVSGNMDGTNYSASGTNLVIFNGTGSGQQFLNGFNQFANPISNLQNFRATNTGGVNFCGYVRVVGFFDITTPVPVSSCSSYQVNIYGPITTAVGSAVTAYQIQIGHPNGTANVLGAWAPSYTDIIVPNAVVKPTLAYGQLRFFATDSLQAGATYTTTSDVLVDGVGTTLAIHGAKLNVGGQFTTQNSGRVVMVPNDTLSVAGNVGFNSATPSPMSGGLFTISGNSNYMNTYVPSGTTHRLRVANPNQSAVVYGTALARPIPQLEVTSPFGMQIGNDMAITDSMLVPASGANVRITSQSAYTLDIQKGFVTSANSAVYPYAVTLSGTSNLNNVAGTFAPGYLSVVTNDPTPLRVASGIQYSNVNIYVPITLQDSLVTSVNTIASNGPFAGNISINNAGTILDLNGHKVRASGGFDANTNAILRMVNAADTLIAGDGSGGGTSGYIYLDGGTGANSILQNGVIIQRGNAHYTNVTASLPHTIVITDSGLAPGARTMLAYSASGAQTLGNLAVRGTTGLTMQFQQNFTLLGSFDVKSGPTINGSCNNTVRVTGPLTTAAGSAFTGGGCSGLYVEVMHATGTANVNGLWQPAITRFLTANQTIKPSLNYQAVEIYADNAFTGNTTMAGSLSTTGGTLTLGAFKHAVGGNFASSGASTQLLFGGSQLNVAGSFTLNSASILNMTNPTDTLAVGTATNPAGSGFNSNNGSTNSIVTDGVIRVRGDIAAYFLPATGNAKLILDSAVSASNQLLYTNGPSLNRVQVLTNRNVLLNSSVTVADSFVVSTPIFFGQGCCGTLALNGPASTVASSTLNPWNLVLGHQTAAANIQGNITLGLSGNTITLTGLSQTVPVAARFTYYNLQMGTNATATVPLGATLQLGTGASGGNINGFLTMNAGSVLSIPSTSSMQICSTGGGMNFVLGPPPANIQSLGGSFKLPATAATYGTGVTNLLPGVTQYSQPCP